MTDDSMKDYKARTNHKNYILNVLKDGPYKDAKFSNDDVDYIVEVYEDTLDALSQIETNSGVIHNMFALMITSWMGITLLNKEVLDLREKLNEYE
jgi:hypothetical protein